MHGEAREVSAHVQSCCVRSRDCYSNSRGDVVGISPSASPRPSHTHTPYDIHKAEKGDGRWAHAYTRVPVVRSEDNVDKGHGAGQGESTRLWSGPRTTLTRDNVSYELTVTVPCVSRTSSRMFTFTRHMRSPPKPVSAGPVSPSHASLERAFPSETPESCAIAQQPGLMYFTSTLEPATRCGRETIQNSR